MQNSYPLICSRLPTENHWCCGSSRNRTFIYACSDTQGRNLASVLAMKHTPKPAFVVICVSVKHGVTNTASRSPCVLTSLGANTQQAEEGPPEAGAEHEEADEVDGSS